jgi:hypothetical protein
VPPLPATADPATFSYRGVKLGVAGLVLSLGIAALMDVIPRGLLFTAFLAGWTIVAAGVVVHVREMLQQHRDRAAQRQDWLRHGDPDRRDDPLDRSS